MSDTESKLLRITSDGTNNGTVYDATLKLRADKLPTLHLILHSFEADLDVETEGTVKTVSVKPPAT